MDSELQNFINSQKYLQVPDEEIKQKLITAGWNVETVAKSFPSKEPLPNTLQVEQPKKFSVFLFVILPITLFIILASLVIFYLAKHPQKVRIATTLPNPQNTATIPPPNTLLAYLQEGDSSDSKIVFYDLSSSITLAQIPEFLGDKSVIFQLGPWSPDGIRLPLEKTSGIPNNNLDQLFMYHQTNKTITKIFEKPSYSKPIESWPSTLYYSAEWIDNNTLKVGEDLNSDGSSTLTTISVDGKLSKVPSPKTYKTIIGDLSFTGQIPANLTYKGNPLNFVPKGQIIGVIGQDLITVEMPKGLNLAMDDSGVASSSDYKKFTDLEKAFQEQGLAQEQIQQKIWESVYPKVNVNIYFTNLKSGNIDNTIQTSSAEWITKEAQVLPDSSGIILRQTDRKIPEIKDRYLKITTNPNSTEKEILQVDSSRGGSDMAAMTTGNGFNLSQDGKVLVGYSKDPASKSILGRIFTFNLISNEYKRVCDSCGDIRVYNPKNTRLVY